MRRRISNKASCGSRVRDDSFFDENTAVKQPDELYRSAFDGEQIASDAARNTDSTFRFCAALILRTGSGAYPAFARIIEATLPVIGAEEAVSANIHADDAARAFVTVAEAGARGLWHITDDEPMTIRGMCCLSLRRSSERRAVSNAVVARKVVSLERRDSILHALHAHFEPAVPRTAKLVAAVFIVSSGFDEVIGTWRTEGFANRRGLTT